LRALSRTGINRELRLNGRASEHVEARVHPPFPLASLGVRAQKRKVINEPRLNPITHRGGIFWLVAAHGAPFAGSTIVLLSLSRYPFSPLTFNAFPARERHPCQSQASAPQILQNTDINRLITRARTRAHGPGRPCVHTRRKGDRGQEGGESAGLGGAASPLEIWRCARRVAAPMPHDRTCRMT